MVEIGPSLKSREPQVVYGGGAHPSSILSQPRSGVSRGGSGCWPRRCRAVAGSRITAAVPDGRRNGLPRGKFD